MASGRWLVRAGHLALTAAVVVCGAGVAPAANTVTFSVHAAGVDKSVAEWGVDTAWPSYDNVRQSIAHMGAANVDVVRMTFHPAYPLTDNGNGTFELSATAKGFVDNQLALVNLAGAKPIGLLPGEFTSSYDQTHWLRTIKATQEYINSRPGFETRPTAFVEVFNEPDFWAGQGTPANLNTLITQLKAYPEFQNTEFPAGSTLNSNNAGAWYDPVPAATQGSSHLLGGSLTNWVNFIEHVKATGRTFTNPELHSLGEAIVGAEHGMVSGTYWADVLRARGLFVQASDGDRLGYFEDLGRQSAAAVYRAPDGEVYAFAGGLERFGQATSYRFVSTDADVYFGGIPVREYMLHTKFDQFTETDSDFTNYGSWSNQGAYVDIDTDGAGIPALDGHRWKIVNIATGKVLEVSNGSTVDGGVILPATDSGTAQQLWNITRTPNGYYHLYNANSGLTAEVAGGSLANNAVVRQWGTADNATQQWYIEQTDGGAFHIRNANSNKYLTNNRSNIVQGDLVSSGSSQLWQFVLANPTPSESLVAKYDLNGSALDSAGTNHATLTGGPSYATGVNGQALRLDGANDYLTLPGGIANSEGITVAAWVQWDGGSNWQRIFDFGTGTSEYMYLTPSSGAGTMQFAIRTNTYGAEQVLETEALRTGEWVHVALTLGGNTGVLYIDGKPQVAGQILLDPSDFNPTNNYIGKSQFADPLLSGLIDELQIYDRSLTVAEVAALVGVPDLRADLNLNGMVDAADWTIFAAHNLTDLSSLPLALRAAKGDLDRDGDNDFADYRLFQQDFTALYGPAAFTNLLSGVPEPSGVVLGLVIVGLVGTRLLSPGRAARGR